MLQVGFTAKLTVAATLMGSTLHVGVEAVARIETNGYIAVGSEVSYCCIQAYVGAAGAEPTSAYKCIILL
jgi:hypothetical protein